MISDVDAFPPMCLALFVRLLACRGSIIGLASFEISRYRCFRFVIECETPGGFVEGESALTGSIGSQVGGRRISSKYRVYNLAAIKFLFPEIFFMKNISFHFPPSSPSPQSFLPLSTPIQPLFYDDVQSLFHSSPTFS